MYRNEKSSYTSVPDLAILDNFKANYHSGLIGLGIIKNKSELTYERIYELSQDADIVSLLNENEYTGVRDNLEEYAELYTSVRKQGDVL